MLRPPEDENFKVKLNKARELLHDVIVSPFPVPERVYFKCQLREINSITTVGESFYAESVITMRYLVHREDVFRYLDSPHGWEPWVSLDLRCSSAHTYSLRHA